MLPRHNDPIAAIATAPGRGAVGIVRVSGKGVAPLVRALCGRDLRPREATYLPFRDAQGGPIDHGLALFFPAPHSYTGEDVLELQAHGGPVVLQLLLARCLEAAQAPREGHPGVLPGLRLAQPGEFTERAFLNDKIDLAQAEAIADLIDASTEAAARSASRSLSGAFTEEIPGLRDALVHLRMLVEATLDFPEEEIDFLQKADASGQLARLRGRLDQVLSRAHQGALLPLHVIDTAGLRESSDEVERIGIARAWDEIAAADAVLFLHDLTRMGESDYLAADAAIAETLLEKLPRQVPVIDVWNKTDRAEPAQMQAHGGREGSVALSARTGDGLDALRRRLLDVAGWQSAPEGLYLARARHVEALQAVAVHLDEAELQLASQAAHLDLLAEELRLAQVSLNAITGEFSSDDLLGVIFSSFCIGK
jgi:tRNA modification GTPase